MDAPDDPEQEAVEAAWEHRTVRGRVRLYVVLGLLVAALLIYFGARLNVPSAADPTAPPAQRP